MQVHQKVTLFSLFTLITQVVVRIRGSATLQMKMISFKNDANKDASGDCCDNFIFVCNVCDTFFIFCIDQFAIPYNAYSNVNQCSLYRGQTGEFANTKNVYFDHDMHPLQNPIEVKFANYWTGAVILKVEAWDDDTGHSGHDKIEDGLNLVWNERPARTYSEARYVRQVIRGRTGKSLTVDVRCWCDADFYGPTCNVRCVPRDDATGHYTCNRDTGAKVCMAGWEGANCEVWSNDCRPNRCRNGAQCIDGARTYTCVCSNGFTGRNCEINIQECSSSPCRNGATCVDGAGGFTCTCAGHYVGDFCEKEACEVSDPCQHGGTCYKDRKCLCPPEYTGKFCETDKCSTITCYNGATCTEGACQCAEGFSGRYCSVDACSIKECFNGGVCVAGKCNCTGTGYTGSSCHEKIDYCSTLPCNGNGDCENGRQTYFCHCFLGYTGQNCETELTTTQATTSSTTTWPTTPSTVASMRRVGSQTEEPTEERTKQHVQANSRRQVTEEPGASPVLGDKSGKTLTYIIAGSVASFFLILVLPVLVWCVVRRRQSKDAVEDPYATVSASPSGMSDFSNPIYDNAEMSPSQNNDTAVTLSAANPAVSENRGPSTNAGRTCHLETSAEQATKGHKAPGDDDYHSDENDEQEIVKVPLE